MSGFPTSGLATVSGVEYTWEVKHLWGASSMYDNYRGLAITVALNSEAKLKELTIEFPISEFRWERQPTKSQLMGCYQTWKSICLFTKMPNPSIKWDWLKLASMKTILITTAVPTSSPAPYHKR